MSVTTAAATAIKIAGVEYPNTMTTTENSSFEQVLDTYLCIQQQQKQSNIDEEEQQKRNKLIQAATNRLRQKLLENKYEKLISEIVELQCKLDIIKLETSISLNSIIKEDENMLHLDHFEKRLENHKLQLQSIIIATTSSLSPPVEKKQQPPTTLFSSSLSSFSKSSFSSTISSILSIKSDTDSNEQDYYAILGGGGSPLLQKRRKRQQSKQKETIHPLDITSENNRIIVQAQESEKEEEAQISSSDYTSYKRQSSDIGRNELLVLHSIHDDDNSSQQQSSNNSAAASFLSNRNALDDTLSFLNDLASDTDDGGFRQDIIQLLDNIRHSSNSSKASSISCCYSMNHSNILLLKRPPSNCYFNLTATKKHNCFIKKILSSSWKWVRFALIMTLAILINLKKGPQSL